MIASNITYKLWIFWLSIRLRFSQQGKSGVSEMAEGYTAKEFQIVSY